MVKKLKETVEAFKRENGNNDFTQKDMVIYLVQKVDKIHDKIENGSEKIGSNRQKICANQTAIKYHHWIIGGICAVLFSVIGYLIKFGV